MNSSTKLRADIQQLRERRETIVAERETASESLKTATKSIIAGTSTVNEITSQKLLVETFGAAISEIDYQIEDLESKLQDILENEARAGKIRKILALDSNAESKRKELESLIHQYEDYVSEFDAKRKDLIKEIGRDISEFNQIGEEFIPGLVRSRSEHVEGIEKAKEEFFDELKQKGAKLSTLRAGRSLEKDKQALNSSHENFKTKPENFSFKL